MLTTQYLEEADRLADHVVVLDHGKVVARGTPAALKAEVGGDRLVITCTTFEEARRSMMVVERFAEGAVTIATDGPRAELPLRTGVRLVEIVRALDAAGIEARDIAHRPATLDDVFLSFTRKS